MKQEMKHANGRARLAGFCALAVLALGVLIAPGVARGAEGDAPATPPGLLLWNKLGSIEEIMQSAVGPGLDFFTCEEFACGLDIPGQLQFEFGGIRGAASITGGPYFSTARIHTALLRDAIMSPERGTVEAWYRQGSDPVPFGHDPHRIFGGPYSLVGVNEVNLYVQDDIDSSDPRLEFTVFFGQEPCPFVEAYVVPALSLVDGGKGVPISSHNGRWIHVAGVWDRNGIAGTTDTVRLYVDGTLVAATQVNDWGTTTCDQRLPGADRCISDVVGCNDTCADKFVVDNLKIWDYAKTDFSDRFQ
jgi:hypothetical protein